jgi:hypothetical protein
MQYQPGDHLPLAYPISYISLLRQYRQHTLSTAKESLYVCEIVLIGKDCPAIHEQLSEWLADSTQPQFSLTGLVLN